MWNVKSINRPEHGQEVDSRLKALLQEWRGIEPSATFEASVWRRIRTAAVAEQQPAGLWVIARAWLNAQSVWIPATVTAGLVLGVSLALSLPSTQSGPTFAAPLVHSRTLAGAYLTMASGGIR